MRKELRLEDITCIVDSREVTPFNLDPLKTEIGTLKTGDYSVKGLENQIVIERKSLSDLIMCVGRERERFEACIQRLLAYETKAIVIEASWGAIELGQWRGQVKPNVVIGSLLSWMQRGIPIILAGTPHDAGRYTARLLYLAARKRWEELQSFYASLKIGEEVRKGA